MRMSVRAVTQLCAATLLCAMAARPGVATVAAEPAVRALPVMPDLGPGARLTRLAASRDDLYTIDAAPGHVQRYILHGLPYAEQFTQVMRWKEGADGLIMGRPLDLALSGERLLILDSLGSLWSYWGPDYSRVLVPLRLQSNQGTPVAVALHGADLLLLDPGKRAIWRYTPDARGSYDTRPHALTARPLAALSGALRLAVTRDALLVLCADGRVLALPWAHPDDVVAVHTPFHVTALSASAAGTRMLVASANQIAMLAPGGAVLWRATLAGLGSAAITDIARSPAGTLYVTTPARILRVAAATPPL